MSCKIYYIKIKIKGRGKNNIDIRLLPELFNSFASALALNKEDK
jgi:hypothetical protein